MPTTTAPKLTKNDVEKLNQKERELMRIVLEAFEEYRKREQHYYLLEGMSTYHISGHATEQLNTMYMFWPKNLIKQQFGTTIYELDGTSIRKLNSAIRDTLGKLADKGFLEKIGNEHERRWRPAKSLKGVTL